jgi:hypothetical protein
MGKQAILAGLSALALIAAANASAAQSCGSEVERLAQQYNLSPETPQAGSSETAPAPAGSSRDSSGAVTTTERAARASGVAAPPDTGATAAVQPPAASPDQAPPQSDTAPPSGAADAAGGLSSGDRMRMQSMLQQAMAAERQGKFTECLDLLRKAASLAGVPGTK